MKNWFSAALLLTGLFVVQADYSSAQEAAASAKETTASKEHPALVPVSKKGKFHTLHQQHLKRGKEGPIGVLFLGDSITERWTSAPKVWERHFAKWNPANFGIGGDRTQHVLWRIDHGALDGINPKVLVLMIGTNNSNSDPADAITAGVTKIVRQIQGKLPETKILLLGIFPRNPRKDKEGNLVMKPLETIRQVNPELARLADGEKVRYLDITDRFVVDGKVPNDVMPDGVHLSDKGYEIWADAIDPVLEEMMKGGK